MSDKDIENIGYYTVNFLNDFTKKINSCKDLPEYFNLVTAVYIFQMFVTRHLREEFQADAKEQGYGESEIDEYIEIIKTKAESLAEEFYKSFGVTSKKHKPNTDIN